MILRCLAFLLSFTFLYTAQASALTLSGTIYGDSDPLENAVVTLMDGSQNELPTTTSAANGAYDFSGLADESYKLTVTPPDGSAYGPSPMESITPAGSDVTHNVVLLSAAVSINGRIVDGAGSPLEGVTVKLYQEGVGIVGSTITTTADGQYQYSVTAGSYRVSSNFYEHHVNLTDEPYYAARQSSYLDISSSTSVADLVYPFVVLSGKTLDSNGVAVPGVTIKTPGKSWTDSEGEYYSISNTSTRVTSNTDGNYRLVLFPYDNYQVTIIPPAQSGFAQATLNNFAVLDDLTTTIVMPFSDNADPVILSGPIVTNITDTTAVVTWTTDEPHRRYPPTCGIWPAVISTRGVPIARVSASWAVSGSSMTGPARTSISVIPASPICCVTNRRLSVCRRDSAMDCVHTPRAASG